MTSSTDHPRTAVLKFASAEAPTTRKEIDCLFGRLERKILTLTFTERPPVAGAVSVEYNDAMFLGEIVRVAPAANGQWHAEILVEQILTGLQNLLRFRASLAGEGVGPGVQRKEPVAVYA